MNDGFAVARTQRTGGVWTIPKEFMDKTKINENEQVTLHFGSAQISANVDQLLSSGAFHDNIIGLSDDILNTLQIPANSLISVRKVAGQEFRLGPLIGILTSNSIINAKKLGYYKKPAIINRQNGILYVFSEQGIRKEDKIINGYYYDHLNDIWVTKEFPFPDVVINRCYPNNCETVALLEKVIGTKVFNKNNRINKTDFYSTLKADRYLSNFIPETYEFNDFIELTKYIERYRKVYLKPVNGLRGQGIICLTQTTENLLKCTYQKGNKKHSKILLTINDVFSAIENISNGKKYIVQAPIQSMTYEGSNFSIRTWAMKNGSGDWLMPGMYASLSSKESFLTNISAGSKIIPLNTLFKKIIPNLQFTKAQLMIFLEELTIKTAEALDVQYGPLGLLGIDIMIDENGKVWLIEGNGNPGQVSVNKQREYFSWPTQLYQYQLAYATYLAGFKEPNQVKSFKPLKGSLKILERYRARKQEISAEAEAEAEIVPVRQEKIINAMVVVAKKTVQEVREIEVTPLIGLPAETAGSLVNQIRIEASQDLKLDCHINSDKLNIIGYIPVRLIYQGISVNSGNDMGLIQEITVPFISTAEIKGLQNTDVITEKITMVSSAVSLQTEDRPEGSEETAKLKVKLLFNCQFTVTRQCLLEVSAKEVEIAY